MNSAVIKAVWTAAGLALAGAGVIAAKAADESADGVKAASQPTNAPVPGAVFGPSPVETFRKLLAMQPAEREQFLARYPADTRQRMREKMEEYQLLPPELRELRLRVTELRWYLLPMLKTPPAERAAKIKSIPQPYHDLVAARLQEWDIWPPPLKDQLLEYESMMDRFVSGGRDAVDSILHPEISTEDVPEKDRESLRRNLAQWQLLPIAQRRQLYASFKRYLELTEEEKQKTLESLAEPERQETEKILDPIEKWPKAQQDRYLAAFKHYAEMSAEDRQQFIRNAEHWQKMSAEERQAWRDLIQQLADTPPLPSDALPQPASAPAGSSKTNPNAGPVK